jgi:hypothetical protein
MSMVSSYQSFAACLTRAALTTVVFSSVLWMTTADAWSLSIPLRGARRNGPRDLSSPRNVASDTAFSNPANERCLIARRSDALWKRFCDGPNVLRLSAGASAFEVFASNLHFLPPQAGAAGRGGICFGGDGNLYVTTYAAGGLFHIDHGTALPDALRPLSRRSFLLVEGAGTLETPVTKTRALRCEPFGRCEVDATGAARRDGELSFESARHNFSPCRRDKSGLAIDFAEWKK